jgi:predicted AlkP superfamily phosphohydrolase/phosphomutase
MIGVFIFLAIVAWVPLAMLCFFRYRDYKEAFGKLPKKDEDKLHRELTDWYRNLTDEEREKVNEKGIYIGWRR